MIFLFFTFSKYWLINNRFHCNESYLWLSFPERKLPFCIKNHIFAVLDFFHPVSCFSLDTLLWFSPWEETPKLSEIFSPKNSISNDSHIKPLFDKTHYDSFLWFIIFTWRTQRWKFILKILWKFLLSRNSFLSSGSTVFFSIWIEFWNFWIFLVFGPL